MLAAVATVLLPTAPAWAGTAHTLLCTGNAGPAYTQRTVTATITAAHRLRDIVVRDQTGALVSRRTTAGTSLGASDIHSGYLAWDVTATNPEADLYQLHLPAVLSGRGGFTDADLVIQWAGGANGSLQIPMFDCRISGGTWAQAHPWPPALRVYDDSRRARHQLPSQGNPRISESTAIHRRQQ